MSNRICICITGAAGQVANNLIPYIAGGHIYGEKKIILKLLDIPEKLDVLKGIKLEIEDSCYKAIEDVIVTDKATEAFSGVNRAILIGGKPRRKGMTRSDLLLDNAKIFEEHGKILNELAEEDIHVLVVANPSNTNCYIAMKNAPNIPKNRFSALSYLDLNRAYNIVSKKVDVEVEKIENIIIWGNHGESIFPDVEHAHIDKRNAKEVIGDDDWVYNEFKDCIKKRGSEIISYKGISSGFSASKAIIDHLRNYEFKTESNKWFCAAIPSDGSYGVRKDLVFSMPIISYGEGQYSIVKDLNISDITKTHIKNSIDELEQEIEIVMKELKKESI